MAFSFGDLEHPLRKQIYVILLCLFLKLFLIKVIYTYY